LSGSARRADARGGQSVGIENAPFRERVETGCDGDFVSEGPDPRAHILGHDEEDIGARL
jgi:hypothetical protein